LFLQIQKRLRVDLNGVPAVGDSLRDIIAAQRAGAAPILVQTGNGQRTQAMKELPDNIPVYHDLAATVDALIK
jgi:D-glycero-D-manno-heptose 1,7-bisphosphate phosphatase